MGLDPGQDGAVLLHPLGIEEVAGSPAPSNPEAVKAKIFEVYRRLSIRSSRRRSLILVLEDLHWVDKASEELLGVLAEDVSRAPIFLLAAHRGHARSIEALAKPAGDPLLEGGTRSRARRLWSDAAAPRIRRYQVLSGP